jgi:hypothetical protein
MIMPSIHKNMPPSSMPISAFQLLRASSQSPIRNRKDIPCGGLSIVNASNIPAAYEFFFSRKSIAAKRIIRVNGPIDPSCSVR